MSDDRSAPSNAKEVLDALFTLVEDPDEVTSMSREEVRAYLQEEGVDLTAGKRELQTRLNLIRSRARLEKASEERRKFQETLSAWNARAKEQISDAKAALIQRLEVLGQSQPEQALIYFNKLEQASDKDIERMLDDWKLLEALDEDKADGN